MSAWTWRLLAFCSALLFSTLGMACRRSSGVLAELELREGSVVRDYATKVGAWESAPLGSSFKVGDAIRTDQESKARLLLSDESRLKLDPQTVIRFLAKPPGSNAQGLDVQSGQAELEVAGEPLQVDTGSGVVRVQPGTRLRLTKTAAGTRFSVLIGTATLDGSVAPMHDGQSIEIGIGRAVIEPAASAVPASSVNAPGTPSAPESTSALQDDASTSHEGASKAEPARGQGPEVVDMSVAAGDSLIIHDPHPPTALSFSVSKCSGAALLEVGHAHQVTTVGTGNVHGSFPAGASRYRVLCLGESKPVAEGTVSVLHDAGNRRLPSSAPATRVDTDGRRYTVLYQNLLPQMSARWPNAPQSGPFSLSVRSPSGVQKFSAKGPYFAFPAGALHEGSHTLWFEAPGARSPDTFLVVQFDNAAPTASITAPADGSFAPGAPVAVAGTALPGWSVSVGAQELPQDAQHRFSGQAQANGGLRALAIRFANPQRGTQYYLRRSSN